VSAKPPQSVVAQVRALMKSADHKRAVARGPDSITGAKVPLDEFVALLYECNGSAYQLAKRLNMAATMVCQRRKNLEEALGIELPRGRPEVWRAQSHRQKLEIALDHGTILAGSDLHAWPELYGTAMAAFVNANRQLKPDIVILNGDGLDGAKISRHARIGWDKRPSVKEELDALGDFLEEVRKANPNAKYIYTLGNHSMRFETYLSSNAPEVEGLKGTTLAEYIPGWQVCMAVMVNKNLLIKHRHKSGVHNAWQNVRDAGIHIVTGHTHRQVCRPWTNFGGTWYGTDLGMLAPVDGPQFDYCEIGNQGLSDWRSGFAVFTLRDGQLMPPDLCTVTNEERGEVYFRGATQRYEL
jgi:hypothetical protein